MTVGAVGLPVPEDDRCEAHRPFLDCDPEILTGPHPHDCIAAAKPKVLTTGRTATAFAGESAVFPGPTNGENA